MNDLTFTDKGKAFQSSDFGRSFLMIYSGKQEMPSSCLMRSQNVPEWYGRWYLPYVI